MRDDSLRAVDLPATGVGSASAESARRLPLGDREELGALLSALAPRLEAVAMRITRDRDSARDVVQNAFLKVLRHGDNFRGQARVSTWIHRIVANEALMWLRTERRLAGLRSEGHEEALAVVADDTPDPGEALDSREREDRLRDGIIRLSREERDVVLRCSLSDWSYAEYGARNGLHPAAVKSRAFRARRHLQRLMADAGCLPA